MFYQNLRSKLDSKFKQLKDKNINLRKELDKVNQEKTNLEVEITEADADYKDCIISEKTSSKIQRMLTDQIEKLREEKGLNRIGLNKDKLVEKMNEQHDRLNLEVSELNRHIKDSKLWAVECMEDMKEERMYRGKLEE